MGITKEQTKATMKTMMVAMMNEGEMLMARMADMIVKIKLNQLVSQFVFVVSKTKNLISRLKTAFEVTTV